MANLTAGGKLDQPFWRDKQQHVKNTKPKRKDITIFIAVILK